MNQIEKAREYAQREHVHKFIRDAAERAFIAGYQDCSELINEIQDLRADAKYKLLAETFEEFLSDRVVIKELKDFWRNRAGLPTTEKDTKQ